MGIHSYKRAYDTRATRQSWKTIGSMMPATRLSPGGNQKESRELLCFTKPASGSWAKSAVVSFGILTSSRVQDKRGEFVARASRHYSEPDVEIDLRSLILAFWLRRITFNTGS